MKLEYLPAASLIRLYSFTRDEVDILHSQVLGLSEGSASSVVVETLPFVEAIDGCRLSFECQTWDQGILRLDSQSKFVYRLTQGGWEDVGRLIEPFAKGLSGFQYLHNDDSEVQLLLSISGKW